MRLERGHLGRPAGETPALRLGWLIAFLVFCVAPLVNAQGLGTVSGVVVRTWDGTPLPGVVVTLRGTTLATQTDARIRIFPAACRLSASKTPMPRIAHAAIPQ